MYARHFTLKLKPGMRAAVEKIADNASSFTRTLNGFISVHYGVNEDDSECSSYSLWETKDDADAAGNAIRKKLADSLEQVAAEPPVIQVYEIYKPNS